MVEDSRIEIDPPGGPNEPPPREPPIIMIRQGSGRWFALGCLLTITALITIFFVGVGSITSRVFGGGPDPQTIASSSLEGLREQNTLIPFSARFVAVITSTQRRFGLSARKPFDFELSDGGGLNPAALAARDPNAEALGEAHFQRNGVHRTGKTPET